MTDQSTSGSAGVVGPTVADLVFRLSESYSERISGLVQPDPQTAPGTWYEVSYAELTDDAIEIGRGLLALGVERGHRIALLAATGPRWSKAHLGLTASGAVNVSVYPTSSPAECAWIVSNSRAVGVIAEDAVQVAKIQAVRDRLPALQWIVVLDGEADGAISLAALARQSADISVDRLRAAAGAVTPQDAYMIMYTSGTTGNPKGAVLTHANYRFMFDAAPQMADIDADSVLYLLLPLAHAFALLYQLFVFDAGAKLVYWGGNPALLAQELAQTRPTHFPAVPRIFDKLFSALTGVGDAVQRAAVLRAGQVGFEVRQLRLAGEPVPADLQAEFEQADSGVLAKVRGLFGGRVRRGIVGGAPASVDMLEFFFGAGIPVTEGFGMTETSTCVSMNPPDDIAFGTCGVALPGVQARTAADGELLIKGPNVFGGYFDMPEATAAAFDPDGWFRTGDMATIDEDGHLSIVGRKKDIIITAGGKNVAPENLENQLKLSRWISQAVAIGDRRPYLIALIAPDPATVAAWAVDRGIDAVSATTHEDFVAMIQSEIDTVNEELSRPAQIKRFAVLPRDLSQEAGELTPTLKVRRQVVEQRYQDLIEALYAPG